MTLLVDPNRVSIGGERARVLQLVKAVSTGNWGLVARVVRGAAIEARDVGWNDQGLLALQIWLAEVLGNQTSYYTAEERFGLDRRIPYRQLVDAQRRAELNVKPSLAVALCAMALMGH